MLLVTFVVSGCAIDRVRYGTKATDFSDVYAGMARSDFENLVGPLVEQSKADEYLFATYEYDRGYIGCVASGRCQEVTPGVRAWSIASEAFATIGTAGGFEWVTWYEIKECQTGFVRVRYGPDGRLVGIRLLAPEPYKNGTYLWDRDIRKPSLGRPCREVYYHPLPSTIPDAVLEISLDPEVRKSIYGKQSREELSYKFSVGNKAKKGEPEQLFQFYNNTISIGSAAEPAHQSLCQSADKGNPDARYRLGLLFEFGLEGFKKDFSKAYLWYALAGESGKYRGGKNALRMKKEHLSSESFLQAEDMVRRWKPGQCELDLPSKDLGN